VKSVKPRARKVYSSTPLRLLRVERVKLEGPELHVSSIQYHHKEEEK